MLYLTSISIDLKYYAKQGVPVRPATETQLGGSDKYTSTPQRVRPETTCSLLNTNRE